MGGLSPSLAAACSMQEARCRSPRHQTRDDTWPCSSLFLGPVRPQVLATNHVFDILVRAMGSGGDLRTIEAKALPPRKRAGWTGGDDRPVKKSSSIDSVTEGVGEAGDGTGTDEAAMSSREEMGVPNVEQVGGGMAGMVESEARIEGSVGLDTGRESREAAGERHLAEVGAGKGVGSVNDDGDEDADGSQAEDAVDVPCGASGAGGAGRTQQMPP